MNTTLIHSHVLPSTFFLSLSHFLQIFLLSMIVWWYFEPFIEHVALGRVCVGKFHEGEKTGNSLISTFAQCLSPDISIETL